MKKLQDLKMKLRSNKGFTLVEMIVVIAIIAILIALIAPNVAKLIGEATDTKEAAKAKSAYNGLAAWSTKLIKDDFAFQTNAASGASRIGSSDNYVYTLTGTTAEASAQKLWKKTVGATAVTPDVLIGDGAYLPGNTLTDTQTIYAYFTSGGVLTAVVVVEASQANKVIGVSGSVTGLTLPPAAKFDNASLAGKAATADGKTFTAIPT